MQFLDGKRRAVHHVAGLVPARRARAQPGRAEGRERVKVVEREDMFRASEPHKA